MLLNTILKHKPPGFISVPPELPVSGVVSILAEKHIGVVLVVDGENNLLGILSERDIVTSLASRGAATLALTANQLMTPNPVTGTPATTVAEAMEVMTARHFRHLPILDNGRLMGLISIGDVVKARIDQSEYEVETLRTYVGGKV